MSDLKGKDLKVEKPIPVTDLDSGLGRVKRTTALFQQKPVRSNSSASTACTSHFKSAVPSDPYYDTVAREESNVDG